MVTKSTERRLNRSSWAERATASQVQNILRLDFEISNSITGFASSLQWAVGVLPQKCRSIIQQSERSRSQHPGKCQYTACTLLTIPCWQGCPLWTVAFAPPSCARARDRDKVGWRFCSDPIWLSCRICSTLCCYCWCICGAILSETTYTSPTTFIGVSQCCAIIWKKYKCSCHEQGVTDLRHVSSLGWLPGKSGLMSACRVASLLRIWLVHGKFSTREFRNLAVYTVTGAILLKCLTAHTS